MRGPARFSKKIHTLCSDGCRNHRRNSDPSLFNWPLYSEEETEISHPRRRRRNSLNGISYNYWDLDSYVGSEFHHELRDSFM